MYYYFIPPYFEALWYNILTAITIDTSLFKSEQFKVDRLNERSTYIKAPPRRTFAVNSRTFSRRNHFSTSRDPRPGIVERSLIRQASHHPTNPFFDHWHCQRRGTSPAVPSATLFAPELTARNFHVPWPAIHRHRDPGFQVHALVL